MECRCEKCNGVLVSSNVELTEEYMVHDGVKLFRIVASRDFRNVKRGDIGGFVQTLSNVLDEAWVADNAKVYGKAVIKDHAVASENSIIKDNAVVSKYALIKENATIEDNAKIFGWAKIYGSAVISGNGQVSQEASVSGNAEVRGLVFGQTYLTCRAFVEEYTTVPGIAA